MATEKEAFDDVYLQKKGFAMAMSVYQSINYILDLCILIIEYILF